MAVNFPTSLDNFTNPAANSSVANPSHSQQHSDANDAIEALEAKVGVTNSSVPTSHDYRIVQLETLASAASGRSIYQYVRNQSGVNLLKGTPVYVTGSEGASGRLLVSAASYSSEATSSKTIGLITSDLNNGTNGTVVTNGILEGIDTTGASDGDAVWLGPDGTKIFGLVNKPYAPNHLVYLGVVVRGGQQNTGSIYVSVQNGFELQELHNVALNGVSNNQVLRYESSTGLWKNKTIDNLFEPAGSVAAHEADTTNVHGIANTADLATQSYVTTAIANLVNSSPALLDTLGELASAINNDANFASTISNALALKAPLANPALTGIPTAPTANAGTNTTQIATTAFVKTSSDNAISTANNYTDSAINSLSNTASLLYVPISDVGQPDGVASLDSAGFVPNSQLNINERIEDVAANMITSATHTNISVSYDDNSGKLSFTGIPLTQEQVQDLVSPLFTHSYHTNVSAVYDDENNRIVLASSGGGGGGGGVGTNIAWWLGV